VVAIRGTSSLADLVTDAVVHPEAIDDWLPPAQAKARARAPRSAARWRRRGAACRPEAGNACLQPAAVHPACVSGTDVNMHGLRA